MINLSNEQTPNLIYVILYINHWILIIVKPRKETVYYMDSLSPHVNDKDCKNIVNT